MTTYKDTDLREALRRRYADMPQMPTDFTERMTERMERKPNRRWHWWYWMPVAACLLIVVGIGVVMEKDGPMPHETMTANVEPMPAPEVHEVVQKPVETEVPQPIEAVEEKPLRHRPKKRTRTTEIPDTLGSGIWRSERNVVIALQMLSECEATIKREEQEMRNMVIEATFRATPQPANAVLVTNEAGDYEVIETKRIIEI